MLHDFVLYFLGFYIVGDGPKSELYVKGGKIMKTKTIIISLALVFVLSSTTFAVTGDPIPPLWEKIESIALRGPDHNAGILLRTPGYIVFGIDDFTQVSCGSNDVYITATISSKTGMHYSGYQVGGVQVYFYKSSHRFVIAYYTTTGNLITHSPTSLTEATQFAAIFLSGLAQHGYLDTGTKKNTHQKYPKGSWEDQHLPHN